MPERLDRGRVNRLGPCQRFKTGDDVEQFLVDATLMQSVKRAVEIFQQFVDVLIGAFHRCQAARIRACEGFGTRPEERDKKIAEDECA